MYKRREGLEVMINGKEKTAQSKKFVRLKEGAALYSIVIADPARSLRPTKR